MLDEEVFVVVVMAVPFDLAFGERSHLLDDVLYVECIGEWIGDR